MMDTTHPKARILALEAKQAAEAIDAFEAELQFAVEHRLYVEAKDFIDAIIDKQGTLRALCGTYERYTGTPLSGVEMARVTS